MEKDLVADHLRELHSAAMEVLKRDDLSAEVRERVAQIAKQVAAILAQMGRGGGFRARDAFGLLIRVAVLLNGIA